MLFLVDLPMFLSATVSVLVFYLMSQVAAGPGWRREIRYLPALMAVGIGLSLNNSRAVMHIRLYGDFPGGLKWRGGALIDFDGKRSKRKTVDETAFSWLRLGPAVFVGVALTAYLHW